MLSALHRFVFPASSKPIPITSSDQVNTDHQQKVFRKVGDTIELVDRPSGWKLWFLSHDHRKQYQAGAEVGAADLLTGKFDVHAATRFKTYYHGRDWVSHPLDVKTFQEFVEHENTLRQNTIHTKSLTSLQNGESQVTLETIQDRLRTAADDGVVIGAWEAPTDPAQDPLPKPEQKPRSQWKIAAAWFSSWMPTDSKNKSEREATMKLEADQLDQKQGREDGINAARDAIAAAFPEGVLGKDIILNLFDQSFVTATSQPETPRGALKVSELKSFLTQAVTARNTANTMYAQMKDKVVNWSTWMQENITKVEDDYAYVAGGKMTKDLIRATFRFLIDALKPEIIKEIQKDEPEFNAAMKKQVKHAVHQEALKIEADIKRPFFEVYGALEKRLNEVGT